MKKVLAIVVVILLAVSAFFYFGTYSSGTHAGVVMKISKKGVIFKTWEGTLDKGTFAAGTETKTLNFSIDGSNTELIKKMEEVQLSGQRINLGYEQKYMLFPWQGETKIFAVSIQSSGVIKKNDNSELPISKD